MYQIIRITDKEGVGKTDPESMARLGCIGEAKMEEDRLHVPLRLHIVGRKRLV